MFEIVDAELDVVSEGCDVRVRVVSYFYVWSHPKYSVSSESEDEGRCSYHLG